MTLLLPLALPLAGVLFLLWWRFRRVDLRNAWSRVLSPPVLRYLGGDDLVRHGINLALLGAALSALALSSPATRQADADTFQQSQAWILVADVSRSMTLDDTVPSRLAAMRTALDQLMVAARARPLAMIIFAGDAFLASPPAFDRQLLREQITLLKYEVVPVDGSNLARALSLAAAVMTESDLVDSRVFVLGDTGGSGQNAEAAARHLGTLGHRVDMVVFGQVGADTLENDVAAAAAVDLDRAQQIANAGNGVVVQSDVLGRLDVEALKLDAYQRPDELPGLQTLYWRNQSHWILLLLIPVLLLLFRQLRQT